MINTDVIHVLGGTDIYLIDQIMKGRFNKADKLLDAGCGNGRNMHWFLKNNFDIYGIDRDPGSIHNLLQQNPHLSQEHFRVNDVKQISFPDHFFDAVICSAVLHFANSVKDFFDMLDELCRVLKPGGLLFIRTASDIGIEDKVQLIEDGVFAIPDGSRRFLLTRKILKKILSRNSISLLEDFKTVNVNDVRCMSTLVLKTEQ